ncbi:MAG: hypothetical protein ACKOW9_04440 [Candidatus Paceibacterota bacterium]
MNGLPIKSIEAVRDDAVVLATVAAARIPITPSVIRGLEQWFGDVEVVYPIPEMSLTETEKYDLLHTVCSEIASHFNQAVTSASGDVLAGDELGLLANLVDPLWREVTGILSYDLNKRFYDNRVPDESREQVIEMIKYSVSGSGDVDDSAISEKIKSDPEIRTHLRRLGIDPDSL